MSAMAGALDVRLVKRDMYALGDGALPTPRDVRRSLVVMAVAALVVIVPAAIVHLKLVYNRLC
jgi:cobalamin biosynthesis protein CobD/CbiB